MANRYLCGFDDVDVTSLGYEWQINDSAYVSIVSGRVGNCLRLGPGPGGDTGGNVAVTCLPEGQQTATAGFAVRFSSVATAGPAAFMAFGDTTTTHILLRQMAGGNIGVYRSYGVGDAPFHVAFAALLATSTVAAVANTWITIEVKATIDDSVGAVSLRFHGATTDNVTLTGVDTRAGSTASITRLMLANGGGQPTVDFDDVWVNDTTGSYCTGFMGDMRVDYHLPVSNGTNNGSTPSTGTDRYATIDENPPNTTDYNTLPTVGLKDTVHVESFKNNGATIYAMQLCMVTQKTDAGACAIQSIIRQSGSDSAGGTDLYPSTTWSTLRQNYSLASGDAKRLAAGFNACEYGYLRTV
jgi:hypothetical protein